MGNKKNHAKKNKRLANNWRNIIKTRKVRPQKKALPRSFCLGDTRVVYVDENVNRCPDFESNSDNNSWNNNLLSNVCKVHSFCRCIYLYLRIFKWNCVRIRSEF